ncbi:MAG: PTS lactose transporter subunit IIC [Rhodobacteraceae bacterium]|jgi:PTS system nitrogen regulatory IIA component|nr:PTS lactose transporter subunit IIC [Paracoccaceae bacterium]
MQVTDILTQSGVKVLSSSTSKKRLFQDIGELAAQCYGLGSSEVVEALLERESLGPTGVGLGIALPHARLANISKVLGLFVRIEKPIDFDSVDRQPVDLVFVLLAPENAGVEHLKALALVSRTMRDASTCAKLRANSDPSTLFTVLTEARAPQAA